MDLKRATIQLEADGFRIIDQGAGFEPGVPLTIQYEAGGNWTTKEIAFDREAWSLFHPFRKSMFVYTGARPTRVLIRAMDGGFTDDLDSAAMASGGATLRRRYYQGGNFRSYPDFDDDAWDSDDYGSFFPSTARTPAEPVSASVSAAVPPADAAPVEAAPFGDNTPSDKADSSDQRTASDADSLPPLEYDPRDVTASGRVEASSESLAPADAPEASVSEAGASSAEPNAY